VVPVASRQAAVWAAADRLADRAATTDDLRWHRLHLIAAARMRAAGRLVPERLLHEERLAALGAATAPHVLAMVRAAVPGPLLLLKGPEVAARYPDPALRPFRDLDVLVADAPSAHARLLAAGFEPIDDEEHDQPALHHRAGLVRPGLPLIVELHDRPNWPAALRPPPCSGARARARRRRASWHRRRPSMPCSWPSTRGPTSRCAERSISSTSR
jgi:hypothetical protein